VSEKKKDEGGRTRTDDRIRCLQPIGNNPREKKKEGKGIVCREGEGK